ncbi:MAG: hypothetical protein A2Y21_01325 [Clostridiales bacterium GWC2_40_7]|nr:MAG: hypothetical protein A2Y21_01325 [Clostridiales bacterium GWC2_40_7]
MYEVLFYNDGNGCSELTDLIEELNKKASVSKNERIMLKQIRFYINILESLGTRAGEPFVKHIQDEVWELRPGNNRILFFAWVRNKIILLHHFRKTTNKTPRGEIEKAMNEIKDWKERND